MTTAIVTNTPEVDGDPERVGCEMGNIVGCPPGRIQVGMPVSVSWAALSDGRHVPCSSRGVRRMHDDDNIG